MGNSHGHNSKRAEPSSPSHSPEEMHDGGDKSVLQAKLTNLAIQIGYAGKAKIDLDISTGIKCLLCEIYSTWCDFGWWKKDYNRDKWLHMNLQLGSSQSNSSRFFIIRQNRGNFDGKIQFADIQYYVQSQEVLYMSLPYNDVCFV